MINHHRRVVALIPARAGSKRLKNKNLLSLAGKPLIAWTIESALNTKEIDDVIVSTDCVDIQKVALEFGASVPFLRPNSLASDTATTDDVLMHAIKELSLHDNDILILLQPTSPLRDSAEISKTILQLNDNTMQGVVSVCECEHSPMWSNILPNDLSMGDFIKPEISSMRSQDLPRYYRLNGAIYTYRVAFLNQYKRRFYSRKIKASIMPVNKSIDIDNEIDFQFAEFLMNQKRGA